jgi:hypothetical protein
VPRCQGSRVGVSQPVPQCHVTTRRESVVKHSTQRTAMSSSEQVTAGTPLQRADVPHKEPQYRCRSQGVPSVPCQSQSRRWLVNVAVAVVIAELCTESMQEEEGFMVVSK